MEYRLLGQTGMRVSTVCLGTVYFGSSIGAEGSARIIHRALDLGVNFVDTAESYQRPQVAAAEAVVGAALKGRRHEVVVATKKRMDPPQFRVGGGRDHGLSRRQIVAAAEESLRRLQTDYVDVYYPHHPDPEVPPEEWLPAFDDLVRAGKVRYVGLSNFAAWQIVETLWIADRRNLNAPVCLQTLYNLLDRQIEREVVPAVRKYGLGLVPYSPLAGGVLSGKYNAGAASLPPESRAALQGYSASGRPGHVPVLSERNLSVARRLAELARARQSTPSRLAIAWTLAQPAVTSIIVGASAVEQVDEAVAGAGEALGAEDAASISALGG